MTRGASVTLCQRLSSSGVPIGSSRTVDRRDSGVQVTVLANGTREADGLGRLWLVEANTTIDWGRRGCIGTFGPSWTGNAGLRYWLAVVAQATLGTY